MASLSPLKGKLKVGPFRFKFVETNLNPGSEESFHYGLTQQHEAVCYIHSSQDDFMKQETYFHEMMHTAFIATGLSARMSEGEEEQLIQTLSPVLLDVLQSNPDFTNYVLGTE